MLVTHPYTLIFRFPCLMCEVSSYRQNICSTCALAEFMYKSFQDGDLNIREALLVSFYALIYKCLTL